jgi:ABC-2 type transport system permease protein
VTALIWLIAMVAGILLARPDLLGSALPVVTLFVAMNLLLSRAVFAWVERWLARRRTREALVAIALLGVLSIQLLAATGDRWGKRAAPYMNAVLPALQLLPPGLAGRALAGAARGSFQDVLSSTALLAVYALAFGWLLRNRLRAQYLGEVLVETQAPMVARQERARTIPVVAPQRAEWHMPGISRPALAVFEKEWRYFFRNSAMLLLLAVPLVLILVISVSLGRPQPRGSASFYLSADLAFPAAIAYMFLIISQMAFNSFAFEGRGVQLLFVAPVRFRDVFLGKNLLLGTILALESGLIWLIVSVVFRPPGARMLVTTYAGLLFAGVMLSMVGNWLSIRFPRRMEFGRARRRVSGTTALIGLALQAALLGVTVGAYAVCRLLGQAWLAPLVLLGLSAAALRVYVAALDHLAALAVEKRETLTAELAR